MTANRLVFAAPAALLITLSLFFVMTRMIHVDLPPTLAVADLPRVVINEVIDETPPCGRSCRELTVPDTVTPPPRPVAIDHDPATNPTADPIPPSEIPTLGPVDIGPTRVTWTVVDRDMQPIIRVEPNYPPRYLERGVEGSCLMQFSVMPDGVPANIRATCSNVGFEAASLAAVARWRYQPRVVGGHAVTVTGVETTLEFRLRN